jgi:hypothetical protein
MHHGPAIWTQERGILAGMWLGRSDIYPFGVARRSAIGGGRPSLHVR